MSDVILTKEMVSAASNNAKVEGLVFMRTYTEKPTSDGNNSFLAGTAEALGAIQFKVWAGPTYDKMNGGTYVGKICKVAGKINDFNNTRSLIIDSVEEYEGDEYNVGHFLVKKYSPAKLWDSLTNVLRTNVSPEAYEVFEIVINPIVDSFTEEFAAVNHHDNCVNGLLAHTCKLVKIAQVIKFYPIMQDTVTNDALMVGCAIHDIGKTLEYNWGTISKEGRFLNHLTLGLNLITPYKDEIVALKGEEFYSTLISVIQQHHGEYGERPKTLAAYLVHVFDALEAKLTGAQESIENAVGDTIKVDEFYLKIK